MPKDFLNSDDLTCVLKLPGPGSHSPMCHTHHQSLMYSIQKHQVHSLSMWNYYM